MNTQIRPILHAAIAVCAVLARLSTASAASIPIVNPSFESPITFDGAWQNAVDIHSLQPETAFPHPTDGTHVAALVTYTGEVYQRGPYFIAQALTATLVPSAVYTLQADYIAGDYPIEGFLAVRCNAHTYNGYFASLPVVIAPQSTQTLTLSFKVNADDPNVGCPLEIELVYTVHPPPHIGAYIAYFDNVRFSQADAISVKLEGSFGSSSLVSTEAARLNGICDGSAGQSSCEVTFKFTDLQGTVVGQSTQTIPAGSSGFFNMPTARTSVGPLHVVPSFSVARGNALMSFEVFDPASLRTRLILNWGDGSKARTGDVDFGLATLTASDVGRLSAYCPAATTGLTIPPDPIRPCNVVFEFHDSKGRLLKQSRMALQPGTGGVAELQYREAAIGGAGGPVLIDPCLKVADGAIIGTFALVDSATGRTTTQVYPALLASAPAAERGGDN